MKQSIAEQVLEVAKGMLEIRSMPTNIMYGGYAVLLSIVGLLCWVRMRALDGGDIELIFAMICILAGGAIFLITIFKLENWVMISGLLMFAGVWIGDFDYLMYAMYVIVIGTVLWLAFIFPEEWKKQCYKYKKRGEQ